MDKLCVCNTAPPSAARYFQHACKVVSPPLTPQKARPVLQFLSTSSPELRSLGQKPAAMRPASFFPTALCV